MEQLQSHTELSDMSTKIISPYTTQQYYSSTAQ